MSQTFLFPKSFQPDGENIWYFKLGLFDLIEFIAWNIKGLKYWVAKIPELGKKKLGYFRNGSKRKFSKWMHDFKQVTN